MSDSTICKKCGKPFFYVGDPVANVGDTICQCNNGYIVSVTSSPNTVSGTCVTYISTDDFSSVILRVEKLERAIAKLRRQVKRLRRMTACCCGNDVFGCHEEWEDFAEK